MANKGSQLKKFDVIESATVVHPGHYVRDKALKPAKMTVTQAADLIGISRPNVSNFLNGKASATPDMAARIERAFNIPAQTILDMQAAYDALQVKEKGTPTNAKTYVPPFLAIKANAIEAWAGSITTRIRLSVFLRTLVHSTGCGLSKVDFPGNDDAERPGWDGYVEASEGTPWVPLGLSGWEFGTNINIKRKADEDFAKSVKALSKKEREKITFVFVTPRHWPGKKAWEKEQNEKRQWKEVRVYDADNLEQWLEQSLAGQTWFANETQMPERQVRSLDACWTEWSEVSAPPLTGILFRTAVDAAKNDMQAWLKKLPESPFIIAADSAGEALAFLSQLFNEQDSEELKAVRDRVIVFDRPGILSSLARGAQTFIPIASTQEVERELAPYAHKMHCIIICPRNASNADPDITLEPLPYEAFRKGLEEMGQAKDEISKLEKASGRSLTVLRRQLSKLPAVKTPEWAKNHETAASLVPFLFIGAWNSENETDRTGMSLISGKSYEELEKSCQQLTKLSDPPMWSIGGFRGVVSKIDLLFAIAETLTKDDLKQYFSLARMVLGEDDPEFDLSQGERWAAAIHGKIRKFSSAFRKGVSETLVLLAVHGNALFKTRLNIDTEIEAARVIQDLLPSPLTTRSLEMNNHDLPTYAEAAPDKFLSIVECDLQTTNPAVLGLLCPVDTGIFGGGSSRTGLLWALENLAWNPVTLPRVTLILAQLAQVEINDNLVNKPMHSLESVFRSWMPQTAATHEERVSAIKKLAERFPDVAWKLCVAQFGSHHATGDYSHKPQWRTDGYGHGEPFPTWGPIIKFQQEMVEMTLNWKIHNVNMLCNLVSRLDALDENYQARVWDLIKNWAKTASDTDKAVLREKLRVTCLSNRAARRAKKKDGQIALSQSAKDVYQALEPSDITSRYAWLFRTAWVEESYDEIHVEEIDYQKREERIAKLRTDALREIFKEQGNDGIFAIVEQGQAAWQIGWLLADKVFSTEQLVALIRKALSPILAREENISSRKQLISGALRILSVEKQEEVFAEISKEIDDAGMAELLLLAPFGSDTWKLVDDLSKEAQLKYWTDVAPDRFLHLDTERAEAVDRLLKAERPRAAFSCIAHSPEKINAKVLFRILSDTAKGGKDQPEHYQLEEYYIRQAFQYINESSELSLEEKAGLEFAYIDALSRPFDNQEANLIPNLEKYIETHPELFTQAVAWTYKRSDDGIDPPELRVEPDHIEQRAHNGYKLLHGLKHIPGYDDAGELSAPKLAKWIKTVHDACTELGRGDVADVRIGELLSSAPIGSDGVWPCEAVRDVMEDLHSKNIMDGARTGLYNSRGVHWRGEGGAQERELADKYRKWAQALQFSHPYVSSGLLMGMAKTYENEADREDTAAGVRRRLQ